MEKMRSFSKPKRRNRKYRRRTFKFSELISFFDRISAVEIVGFLVLLTILVYLL